jgi:RING-H2 zinc finger domain
MSGGGGGGGSTKNTSHNNDDEMPFLVPLMKHILPSVSQQQQLPSSSNTLSGDTTTTTTNTTSNKTVDDFNCAVCLEGMELRRYNDQNDNDENNNNNNEPFDESKSILTTVCNHSFHMDCLAQWQDSPCPVCRYDHSGWNDDALLSQCHVCSTTHNNYVCLICGIVSCGGSGGGGGSNSSNITTTADGESHPSTTIGQGATMHDSVSSSSISHLPPQQSSITSNDNSNSCHDGTDNFGVAMIEQRQRHQILPNSHAWKHYNESLHAYALCTETQHVWDFAGQGYVHRLLQNKDDGKLVEVHDPMNTTSQERSSSPGLTQAQESEVVHRKLESFANQYYTLLKSQLEQQRTYYESRLEDIRRDYSNSTVISNQKPKKRVDTAADLIVAMKQERQQLTQRLETIQGKCRKVNADVTFLKHLNESLEANRESLRRQLAEAQRERAETRKMIDEALPPLQEKVTLLMLQLESSSSSCIESNMNDVSSTNTDASSSDDGKRAAQR